MERCNELQYILGINEISEKYPHQISGGQQQRVAIARAIAPKPELLLLDEPFSALDPLSVETIRTIISDLQRSSISCILSDHNISSTLQSVDRAILISNTMVVAEGRPRELLANKLAKTLYFGQDFKI